MKKFLLCILAAAAAFQSYSQLSTGKIISKNGKKSNLGFGIFVFWDFPVSEVGNRSVVIECLDAMYFPPKDKYAYVPGGFVSVKAGYKYIFSEESKTGFYIEPSAGWVDVVDGREDSASSHNGVALAVEGGYSLEVGQRGNNFNFALKFERDMAGGEHNISSIAFRVSYAFHMFRRRSDR